jgi:hypothetical protein
LPIPVAPPSIPMDNQGMNEVSKPSSSYFDQAPTPVLTSSTHQYDVDGITPAVDSETSYQGNEKTFAPFASVNPSKKPMSAKLRGSQARSSSHSQHKANIEVDLIDLTEDD